MEMIDYSKTVYLPKTSFPMKANLSQREPEFLKLWEEQNIYQKILEKNRGNQKYILHDGPPYANGHIHLGTALNKILKDIVIKYKSLRGYFSPYVPGWDCHGMPIEHQIFQQMKLDKNKVDIIKFRKNAASFAKKFSQIQKKEFERLGVFGNWEEPYLTLSPSYEAEIISTFGKLAKKGYIYQTFKPIYWCINCETALAEAEIEYYDKESISVYVKFPVKKDFLEKYGRETSFLIWTTTPWTLPGNTAIALNPSFEYALVETTEGNLVIASKLVEKVLAKRETKGKILKTFKGQELEGTMCLNPLMQRNSVIVMADYVSTEEGTGCVHTAPGHGEDDYYTGLKYNLPILSPVDGKGKFTKEVSDLEGISVFDANQVIAEKLQKKNYLYFEEKISHSYPHCWRCKNPVIFRSTKQWFFKIDHNNLRNSLKENIEKVRWVPPEGKNRISSMVETRPDWCLSRQRLWGVPLPVFYCMSCNKPVITEETVKKVESLVRENGADIWVEKEAKQLLPDNFKCPHCKEENFRKENDILDVWFDSGVSHFAVLKQSQELSWPADLYLEGSDQHRGWFQSSLITSCGITGKAPFKTVLTHGFVVTSDGRKMSKSLGNVITPEEITKKYGAEILRVWVVSENYQQDIRISDKILKNLITTYRNVRNTIRFMLGNLYDFSPENKIAYEELFDVDRWAIEKLKEVIIKVTNTFENFLFYRSYEELHDFCNIYLSSFYLDYLKDRLYTYGKNSRERKSAQTVISEILISLLKMFSPMLSFTSEEAYRNIPWEKKESIFLEDWPEITEPDKTILSKWEKFFEFRKIAMKKIEEKREEKTIRSGLEVKLRIKANDDWLEFLKEFDNLANLLIVSEIQFEKSSNELEIYAEKTSWKKCARCWTHHPTVGEQDKSPDLCAKCAEVIKTVNSIS